MLQFPPAVPAALGAERALPRMHFERKDVIIQQGEPGNMSLPQLRETESPLRLRDMHHGHLSPIQVLHHV